MNFKTNPHSRPTLIGRGASHVGAASAILPCFVTTLLLAASLSSTNAGELGPGVPSFGTAVSQDGSIGLVGAEREGSQRGAVYVFWNLDTAPTSGATLTASDRWPGDYFGNSVSMSGNIGLVGAKGNATSGSAYVYRNLDTATGSKTQDLKLSGSDAVGYGKFGYSVSLDGSTGLVGGNVQIYGYEGTAYLFRDLDTATGSKTEDVKLTASDGEVNNNFGYSVSLSGNIGLVGANGDEAGRGAAYVFRNLSVAPASVTENVKLTASDGAAGDSFGYSVSLSGNVGLVGAYDGAQGAAYLFRDLDTATGSKTEDVKLIASDGTTNDSFGNVVGLSGNTALVGAPTDNGNVGSVYVFRNLDAVSTSTVTESVRITASVAGFSFGGVLGLNGDQFMISGTSFFNNNAYTGSVSSMTTLDTGDTTASIDRVSFVSQEDWVIGQTTDDNQVTLTAGDSGAITADGKAVYIGQSAGSDHNLLAVAGTLTASEIYIGSTAGNTDNSLRIHSIAVFTIDSIYLAPTNLLSIEGDYASISALFGYLGAGTLLAWTGESWIAVDSENASTFITNSFSSGYTTIEAIQVVPEPSSLALLALGVGGMLVFCRRVIIARQRVS